MLEAEITRTGDVTVEGQHVGRLEGFRFAPDPAAGDGEAGKALRAAASKALASEIDSRAEKLSGSGDEAFILSNDGTIRWHGEAVAKLAAGDKVLSPRIRILADEQLTGAPRDQVQARLDLWVHAQIEKLLGPVTALEKSEELQGLARGVAFQLSEAIGVIERQKIADDVKQLDQEARAALRKLGVRFGAYHIYLPATLKPAPRALALQLHMLKQDMLEAKGLAELPALAASGRTSIAVDPEIAKDLYRFVGFRALGPRAVRVDILERLADIIRPALAWRPGTPTAEPAGHFPGGGFTTTVSMTSLVGCSGEDFASILKGLGYRMEKRPVPAPKPVAPEAPAAVEATDEAAPAADSAEPVEPVADGVVTEAEIQAPVEPVEVPAEVSAEPVVAEEPAVVSAEPAVAVEEAAETAVEAEASEEASTSAEPATEDAPAAPVEAAAPAEPAMIEVWRPGGRMDGDRPARRDFRKGGERGGAAGEPGQRRDFRPRHGKPQGEPRGPGEPRPAGEARPPREGQAPGGQHRGRPRDGEATPRPEGGRPPRRDFSKFKDASGFKGPRPEGDRRDRPQRDARPDNRVPQPDRAPRKEREPDPNSPFAKLLALKEAMQKKP